MLGATRRGLPFEVTQEYLGQLAKQQEWRCALTGTPLVFSSKWPSASLDRIDNAIGYVEGNLQWVHKEVNMLRGTLDIETFKKWCKKVAEHV